MSYFNNLSFRQQFTSLAFLSGLLSLFMEFEGNFMLIIYLGMGLIYGLFTLISIKNRYTKAGTKFVWIFLSTFSYLTALFLTIGLGDTYVSYHLPSVSPSSNGFFIAGLFGALILAVSLRMVIKQNKETISFIRIILISLVGGLIPFIIYHLSDNDISSLTLILIYTIWPTVISFLLASSIKKIG